MLLSTNLSFDPRTTKRANKLRSLLADTLTVWVRDPEGVWAAEEEGNDDGLVDPQRLDTIWENSESVINDLGSGRVLAMMPMDSQADFPAIACVLRDGCDVRTMEALLATAHQQLRDQEKIEELSEENDLFAAQLSSDLEELTLLRSMVERLSDGSEMDDLTTVAQRILPTLNETIRARCLALMLPAEEGTRSDATVGLQIGTTTDEKTLIELVRCFGSEAQAGPFVRNWGMETPETHTARFEAIPGIDSLVLTPLISGNVMHGWLAALNRMPTSETLCESPWQLDSDEFGSGEGTLLATTASVLAMQANNREMLIEKEQIMVGVVRSLVSAIEAKDPYTRGHSERVALYSQCIARELGYSPDEAERIYLTGLLHDVGKIGVSDAVLKKAGALTDEEFAEIQKHPDEGWSILSDLKQLSYVLPGVLHHHERFDGQGYPDKLTQTTTPLDGRLMAVADAYDAMTSDRAYRKGMPNAKAEAILREGSGTQWDPDCIEAFFRCLENIQQIQATYEPRLRRQRTASETGRGSRNAE